MEINSIHLRRSAHRLHELLTTNNKSNNCLGRFYVLNAFLNKKDYQLVEIDELFDYLSDHLLQEDYTIKIGDTFTKYLLLLITKSLRNFSHDKQLNFKDYQIACIALAKLMVKSVDVRRFCLSFFRDKPAPFEPKNLEINQEPKRFKYDSSNKTNEINQLTLVQCLYRLLLSEPVYFKDLWDWSPIMSRSITDNTDKLTQLYVNHILAILTNMTTQQLCDLNSDIPIDIQLQFEEQMKNSLLSIQRNPNREQLEDLEEQILPYPFKLNTVTSIECVFLPIYNMENSQFYEHTDGSYDKIVDVDTTKVNLRSIALGIGSGKAICLYGPVGCGKTTLVEYLARKTGRIRPKPKEIQIQNNKENKDDKTLLYTENRSKDIHASSVAAKRTSIEEDLESAFKFKDFDDTSNGFLRIQLGDQTDSKMLLGQYHCTDVPGEFIWLPGVLTEAVMNGYWLLLEDLDSATPDTYTILSSLLERKYLSVPGFRDCVKIAPGFQLFVTVRTKKSTTNYTKTSLYTLLEKYLYSVTLLPLSSYELCIIVRTNYSKLSTVAKRIVDVYLTFSSGDHLSTDKLRQPEVNDEADSLPFDQVAAKAQTKLPNSGRLVSTRDLIKLCERSNPSFSVTSTQCAYFVFQNAVDVFCSYLPQGRAKTHLITSIGAKLGIIQSRCEHFSNDYKPEVKVDSERIKVGRATLHTKSHKIEENDDSIDRLTDVQAVKRQKLTEKTEKQLLPSPKRKSTFSFTRLASCILERIAVCVQYDEPVLLVGETGVGKTSSVQYLAERTQHKLVVVNMNNQSDVSDLIGGFKPVELTYIIQPLRNEFEHLFRKTFNNEKNETFLIKFGTAYNQGKHAVLLALMHTICNTVFKNAENRTKELLKKWRELQIKLGNLRHQLEKSINISFAFIPGSLVNCIKNGDWVLLDEINLASAETLECLSTILEPDGSVVLLERGDFTPIKRHPDFRLFACMNPNTDIGKKDLSVGIRNRFTEFFVDELTTDADLNLLVSDYLSDTGIQKKCVHSIVKLYKKLKVLSDLELNDGLGNRPVYSLRTLCRSLRICAKNLCGSIERNLYESFCLSFLTQLDPASHAIVLMLIKNALLNNPNAALKQALPKLGENFLNFEGYWVQQGPKEVDECSSYILTDSVKNNLKDLARIISIGKLPILLQGPTSAGKTSLIDYVAKRSGNHCLRINNHEHTDLQEYIGTYAADVTGKLTFREGMLVQAMRHGYWIILDELNLASTDILEALNRVLDDNRELFIPETQTVVKAHPNFMLFATQNPPGLYGGRKTLSRAFKNRFIELHFADIPRQELEIILEKRCQIPASYAKKMVLCMADLQMNRKTSTKNVFTLRDLFRWGNRYTYADRSLLDDPKYDWNQHLIEEGYLVLSAKVRTTTEIEIIDEALYRNFKKRVNLELLFDVQTRKPSSPVTKKIIDAIKDFKQRTDIVWTRNMTRMAVLTAKALQFDEPVLLVGPTGCGKTTVCQLLANINGVELRILNCHMHTEGGDFLGGLRPCRNQQTTNSNGSHKLFEWSDGPLVYAMQEGSYFMADEISLAEDSVLERLNCVLEPERTLLLAEKGGVTDVEMSELSKEFVVRAKAGFQFLATMNPGGDFGKKELSPALRNRFSEVWCLPSEDKADLVEIAYNCMMNRHETIQNPENTRKIASYLVEIVLFIRQTNDKFKFSIRDILAWANYLASNKHLTFAEQAIFGLETIFLDAFEMLPHESQAQIESLKTVIKKYAVAQAADILDTKFTLTEIENQRGQDVILTENKFGIKPFFISTDPNRQIEANASFFFDAPTTKRNLFRLLSALSLQKPVLLEGPPGVGKTSIVESIAHAIGYQIVRINLCEHTDLADLFGTDMPAEDNALSAECSNTSKSKDHKQIGSFVWRDGPLLAALKSENTWILLDELNLAPQSVLEGLNAVLDHRGEVYIPELNKSFQLDKQTRIFACQNPLKQGGGRKGLPQSFLNRFNKVYLRKLTTEDLLHVVNVKYSSYFNQLRDYFQKLLSKSSYEQDNIFEIYAGNKVLCTTECLQNSEVPHKELDFDLAERLVRFSETLDHGISNMEFGYKGGPYEFNLRDILRWCDLLYNPETGFVFQPYAPNTENFNKNFSDFILTLYERMKLVYYQRMRSEHDKLFIRNAFSSVFQCDAEHLNSLSEDVALYWTNDKLYLNDIVLNRGGDAQTNAAFLPAQNADQSPLLLFSQREIFKQIVESVHMEKPILLCGSTTTGKTKVIDALCELSNQICNTDTIDDSVTGSFQQIDLNRHLEEIANNIESLLISTSQQTILHKGDPKVVEKLFKNWSKYTVLSNTIIEFKNNASVGEEFRFFLNRIIRLNEVIDILKDLPQDNQTIPDFHKILSHQSQLLSILKNHVHRAKSLNTGGSFEWVDSKIVKSLKCGQYILLEHVNLCSSAVLDRLNSVFEPNGKLMISEKGVSASDTAEIVEKAPNFRAFLTIDPKNGELSRAMRNRCVELALTKDTYDVDDMRAIVYSQGVHEIAAIDAILQIHVNICKLTEINSYTISHLSQFALLADSFYNRIGYNLKRSIYGSAMETYLYAANMDLIGYRLPLYVTKLRDVISPLIKNLDETKICEDHLSRVILRCNDLSTSAMVKMQIEPLRVLLKSDELQQDQLANLFKKFEHLNFSRLLATDLRTFFVFILYEVSSMDDIHIRHGHIEELLQEQSTRRLCMLANRLYECIKEHKTKLNDSLTSLPWNRKLYPRIRDYNIQTSDDIGELSLSSSLLAEFLLDDIPKQSIGKIKQIDVLTYSQAVASKTIPDRMNNGFLNNLSNFLTHLQVILKKSLSQANISLEQYTAIVTKYLWFNRLLKISQQKLFKYRYLNKDLLRKILLHFKWLEKHLLRLLAELHPHHKSVNSEYERCLQKLSNYILHVKHPFNLIQKMYAKHLIQFQPFYKEEQAQIYGLTYDMDQLLSVVSAYSTYSKGQLMKKFNAQKLDTVKQMRVLLNNYQCTIFNYKFKDPSTQKSTNISNIASEVIELLGKAHELELENEQPMDLVNMLTQLEQLDQLVNSQDELKVNQQPNVLELSLQALREYFLAKLLVQSLNKSIETPANINTLYCEELHTLSNETWHLITELNSSRHKNLSTAWSKLVKHISNLNSHDEFEELIQCLNISYKNITTYQRLINKSVIRYQLENLAVRSQSINILYASNTETGSKYEYDGPAIVNVITSLIFQENGQLKPVPLHELGLWRKILLEMRQLLWHNSNLMVPAFRVQINNMHYTLQNAKRLIHEVEYVQQMCADNDDDLDTKDKAYKEYKTGFGQLTQSLQESYKQLQSLDTTKNAYQELQYQTGLTNTLIGALELCLLTFTPLIDPVQKNMLKSDYIAEDINCLSHLTMAYDFMKIIMRYQHFGEEIYVALKQRLDISLEKQQKLSQKLALRPLDCAYTSLDHHIKHFLKTNCEPQVFYKLITAIENMWSKLTRNKSINDEEIESCTETINKIENWLASSHHFVKHILYRYKDYYQDFVQPLQCAVMQTRFGFENLKMVLSQLKSAGNLKKANKLQSLLTNIIEFPTTKTLCIFNPEVYSLVEPLSHSEQEYFKLLKVKLSDIHNRIMLASSINESNFKEFDFALKVCNETWQKEEDRRRKQKAEAESLYVTKTRCATEDEELMELQEIEEIFPTNVEEDFGDFMEEPTLEKVMKLDKQDNLKAKLAQIVRDEDYGFLAKNFMNVMIKYSQIYYHQEKRKEQIDIDIIEAFHMRLGVFNKLYAHYKECLNECMDESTYNTLSFSVGLQQQLLNDINFSQQRSKAYDYYKHSNIPEIISCTDVLNRIEIKVDLQLDLYPEHAGLIDIKRVIERIRNLPSTATVVRFNTGFQLLRQKLSLWNEVAHKLNHLRDEEIEVAEYVQRWTKLELQHWRNCLTQTYESIESHAYRYWFFIYNLLQQFIGQQKVQNNTYIDMKYVEKRFANEEILDEADVNAEVDLEVADVIRILRQFVEAACYGDFHVRLQLLRAFEMYLQNMAKYSEHNFGSLIAGLHNLQIYFAQFAGEIKETNQSRRAPIEKKLKEFVKIESYNKDLSYFSMRNNVARVHRNLNKFLKEYRLVLQEKITPVFQPQDATVKDYNFANDKGRDLRYDTRIKYYMPDTKCFIASEKLREKYVPGHLEELLSSDDNTTLQKIGKHFITARNVVKETVTHANYPNLIIAIDLLLVEQLERCEHLRNLNVDRSKERPKQILEAKQILQQKRKALTDLFKTLTQLGASYKTGLLESSLCSDLANFILPPFCIKTMLGNIKEKYISSNLVRLSENMDLYYAKCVFKLKLLQNIMLTPLSELGPPNIERIKGFAIDMFVLVQNQRELLSNATKQLYDLHVNLQNLRDVAQIISADEVVQPNLLDFSKTNRVFNALKVSLCQIHYVFKQFEVLLVCAPTQENKEHVLLSESENKLCQGSTYYNAIIEASNNILKQSKSTLLDMEKQNDDFLDMEKVHGYKQAHDKIIGELKTVLNILQAPTNNIEHLPSAQPLLELLTFVEETTGDVTLNETNVELPNDFDNIDAELSNVLHAVLLSLQKLYKKHPKPSTPSVTNSPTQKRRSTEAEDGAYELQEQHLKQGLFKELDTDWQLLSMPRINSKLDNILLSLKLGEPTEEKLNWTRKVTTLIPILEQYYLLADYYLLQQLGAHKVSAKLLSVMLTVFVEISTKGFCVPKDLMQDEEGQSKSDQNKGENFGLEDGTGENDASDKIESEDQLDDAKRPEDRKNDDDKKQDQPDCKEEKGIEMSDDFDGKMQDIEKPENEEDDSGESENEEEPNKEMGDTEEGADKLDDQIWGDDEEEDKEDQEDPELNDEDEGKGSKDEKDSHNDLDTKNEAAKEKGKDEHEKDGLDATDEPNNQEDKRKQQEKDIDNMKEPEVDEEQNNPYHNELEEPPEPEDMDLGDMNNDDEGNDNDDEQNADENPFDLDKMKENMQPPEQEEADEGDELEDKDESYDKNGESEGSDSEGEDTGMEKPDVQDKDAGNSEEEQKDEEAETQTRGELENEPEANEDKEKEENAEKREEKPEQHSQSKDKSSKEENVQSVPETEQNSSADQVQNQDDNVKQEQKMDEQETGEEKDGVGQAENETNDGGHQGIAETKETISQEERKNERQTQEKRKQGHTNEERTLGEAEQNKLKQLKTIEKMQEQQQNDTEENDSNEKEVEAEEYQHVKEPKNSDKTTLDNATEEQSKKIQHLEDEPKPEDESDSAENAEEFMEVDEQIENKDNEEQLEQLSAEKHEHSKSDKPTKPEQNTERLETSEKMEIEGDIVPTMTVPRSTDTTAHCNNEVLLDTSSKAQELSTMEQIELRKSYQEQLTKSNTILPQHEAYETWQIIANRMTQNARELCEQLRLILEPTKCTRLKGDYRTGRRINMKKIIPYIASQFRKDKIWLRRTKPAQRDYKITIAIDDSKSMHHNNSKTLTLEAISLVSQALTFLESGRLSIVSFGETPRIILNHTEQFDGPKLVSSLNFAQDKTKIAGLLDFIRVVNTEEGALGGDNGLFENLLLVLSDGRNIFSEGKVKVTNSIKLARLQRIFLVYVIINNPDNKNSILDVQHMEFGPNKSITMKSYMDVFPFPYYVIVRDLNQLPLVLSEAMRQWFELVNSEQ